MTLSKRSWLGVGLLLASLITHFMWLSWPREVVFDEVHFGKFVTAYCCTHKNFFDIHPPHAKLLIAGGAWLGGYHGGLSFENIGQPYGDTSPLPLRWFAALVGSFLPLLAFILLLQLGASDKGAFLGGAILLFDNALTTQTRIIALDGMLLAFMFAGLVFYLLTENWVSKSGSWSWVWISLLSGVMLGLAAGTKFTGLAGFGLVGILWLLKLLSKKEWKDVRRWLTVGLLIVLSAFFVYLLGWLMHFALLTEPGSGDAWHVPVWNKPLLSSFISEVTEVHKLMFSANYGLEATHPDASPWWSWPWQRTSVFYWQDAMQGRSAFVYLLGNPLVWWGSSSIGVLSFVYYIYHLLKNHRFSLWAGKHRYWIPLLGYFIAYVPLMRVPRALFLYHYLTPLIFSVLASVLWIDGIIKSRIWYFVLLFSLVLSFLLFSPLTYGFLLPDNWFRFIFWLPDWR